jgi:hypothetical protein
VRSGPGWVLDLRDVEARGVPEVWMDGWRFRATEGRLITTLRYRVRHEFGVEQAVLELGRGQLDVHGEAAATEARVEVDGRLARYRIREIAPREVLDGLTARLRVGARLGSLGFLERFLATTPFVALSGDGEIAADLGIEDGRLVEPSRLAMEIDPFDVGLFEHRARGAGRLEGRVTAGTAHVTAHLSRFGIRRQGRERDAIHGQDLVLTLVAEDVRLADGLAADVVDLHLPSSPIDDLEVLNVYIPPGTGFAISSGNGHVAAELRLLPQARSGHGTLELQATSLVATYRELTLAGELHLAGRLHQLEPRGDTPGAADPFRFGLDGTSARLERVAVGERARVEPGDWWGVIAVEQGQLALGAPPNVRGTLTAELRDSRPILAVFAENSRIVEWIDGLIAVHDLRGRAEVDAGGEGVRIEGLRVTGDRAELAGRLEMDRSTRRGLLYARYRAFAVAVELDGERRDWKLVRPRRWFDERLARHTPQGESR